MLKNRGLIAVWIGAVLAAASSAARAVPIGAYLSSFTTDDVKRYNTTTGTYEATVANYPSTGSNPASSFFGAIGITFGHDGLLYAVSYHNNKILAIDANAVTLPTTAATFIDLTATNKSQDITYDAARSRYYVNPDSSSTVREYDTTGAYLGNLPGLAAGANRTVLGPDGRLYGTNTSSANVWVYDFNTDTVSAFTGVGSGGTTSPLNLMFGPDGNLYVADYNQSAVYRYNGTTGAFIDLFVTGGSGGLTNATGVVFGPDGNLYVSSRNTNQVLRYNGTTGAYIDVFIASGVNGPSAPQELIFVVPEPASLALLGLGGAMILRQRTRN